MDKQPPSLRITFLFSPLFPSFMELRISARKFKVEASIFVWKLNEKVWSYQQTTARLRPQDEAVCLDLD